MTEISAERIIQQLNLEDSKIISVYQFGSRVYGTNNEKSDYDVAIVIDGSFPNKKNTLKYDNDFDVNFYSRTEFLQKIERHDLKILEHIFLPQQYILLNRHDFTNDFKPDYKKLLVSVPEEVNECLVNAKSAFNQNQMLKGKKKGFHAIRFSMIGNQLALNGRIHDYTVANEEFKKLMKTKFNNADEFEQYISKIVKPLMNMFKKTCQEKIRQNK
jgi:predicted nucleotidyltransferase